MMRLAQHEKTGPIFQGLPLGSQPFTHRFANEGNSDDYPGILALVTARAWSMSSATGCGGMRNFLFGPRCTLCVCCPRVVLRPVPVNPYAPAQPRTGLRLDSEGWIYCPSVIVSVAMPLPRSGPPVPINPNAYATETRTRRTDPPRLPSRVMTGCRKVMSGSGYAGGGIANGRRLLLRDGGIAVVVRPTAGVHYEGAFVDPYLGSGVMGGGMTQVLAE